MDPNAVVKSTTLQPDVQESAIDICKAAMRNEASPKVGSPLVPTCRRAAFCAPRASIPASTFSAPHRCPPSFRTSPTGNRVHGTTRGCGSFPTPRVLAGLCGVMRLPFVSPAPRRARKTAPLRACVTPPPNRSENQSSVRSCSLVRPRSHAAPRPPRNAPTTTRLSPFLFDERTPLPTRGGARPEIHPLSSGALYLALTVALSRALARIMFNEAVRIRTCWRNP